MQDKQIWEGWYGD